jgi:hypothetical protein
MSNLNSIFDILRSWPNGGALDYNFEALSGATLVEGTVFTGANRNLGEASALRIVDDSLVTAPTLTAADRGKSYEIATAGGVWSVFTAGDIVTWDGTGWQLAVAQSGGDPPDGTRAVVVEASAAGSFAGLEKKIVECTSGAWAVLDLADAVVLRIVDDTLITAPALTATDRGKAYMVAGLGGAWSGFAVGDIVEWDGSAWAIVLANVAGEPPDGTRAVVVEASAAGSFAGGEEEVWTYATAGSTWSSTDVPAAGNRILIDGGIAGVSVYDGKYYNYDGTNWLFNAADQLSASTPVEGVRIKIVDDPVYATRWYDYTAAGTWGKAVKQRDAAAYATLLTSPDGPSLGTPAAKPDAWVIIQGNDQWDAQFVGNMAALKLNSDTVFKIQHDDADTLVAGTLLQANAGVLEAHTDKWPVGQVIYTNGVAGSTGFIHVAAF